MIIIPYKYISHYSISIYLFNPIRSLEPKHILFYYRADCLALQLDVARYACVTKTNKMPIRKQKMLGNNTIVIKIIHIVV